jgi:tRNA G18 (ribose-2'-O)-methylase SpoU
VITSTANPTVKWIRRLQADRRAREEDRAYVVEGTRWLRELADRAVRPQLILVTQEWMDEPDHQALAQSLSAPTELAARKVMAAASDTETAPGGARGSGSRSDG